MPDHNDGFSLNIDNSVATLTVCRPEALNALTAEMVDALARYCRKIEDSREIEVVVLTGEGRAFSAGGDVKQWSKQSASDFGQRWVRHGHSTFDALARLRQPVIALLNGHALGGGLELAACADYRICEAHVKVGQPETGIGIIPGWSGTQRAVRRFGAQNIRKMALFGEVYSADEAFRLGLVDKVVVSGEGYSTAVELARTLKGRGRDATEITKMLINAAEGEETERILEALAGRVAAATPELHEGIAAFHEKRAPDFDKYRSESEDENK